MTPNEFDGPYDPDASTPEKGGDVPDGMAARGEGAGIEGTGSDVPIDGMTNSGEEAQDLQDDLG